MAYISGSKFNFEIRLHEFPKNSGDLNMYIAEHTSYTNVSNDLKNRYNVEHAKKMLSLHTIVDTGKHYN
jgi:hypothetical protein